MIKRSGLVLVALCVVLFLCQAAVWGGGAPAATPALTKPYNPTALTQRSSDLCTDDRFTFAVFGDSYARQPLVSLLKMVDARRPALVVTVGDMVVEGGGEKGPGEWRKLSERAGWFFRAHPTWPVIGNHEISKDYDSGVSNYLKFYGLKDQNFSFTFRKSKFIVLGYPKDNLVDAPIQIAYLRGELADRDKYDHVFVFRHVPFFTVGGKEASQVPNKQTELIKLLDDAHVTATFTGHDHYYYRTRRNGVNHIISGGAGAGIYDLQRLAEQAPGDAYMGVSAAEDQVMLHVPGRVDRSMPFKGYYQSGDELLFAVFVHVSGKDITAEAVSMSGEVWDSFPLAGEGFGAIGAVKAPPVTE